MKTKEELPACPVATTVSLIGSKWKLLIMRNLLARPWRFNELRKDLDGISQKVLLTVLQKEQHLLTATNPNDFQFKAAMGLSCPDDANCDPTYAGFFKQVYGAAKRYQYYLRHEGRYGYHAGRLNYIQYNPNASCGGSNVYIENRATALLYIYTPYQPNAAALEAGAVKAIPARHTATAISRLSTIRCSAAREADASQ